MKVPILDENKNYRDSLFHVAGQCKSFLEMIDSGHWKQMNEFFEMKGREFD